MSEDRNEASRIDDKKMYLIWFSILLMLGVAILCAFFIDGFDFWMAAGVFLIGFGALSFCIKMFAFTRAEKIPFLSLVVLLLGILIIVNSILNLESALIIGIILIAIAVVAAVFIIFKK